MRTMIKNNVEYLYTAENTVNVAICHSMTESQNKKKPGIRSLIPYKKLALNT